MQSDDAVLSLIFKRRDQHSFFGRREDPYKLGLAVEGGSMRAVVTGAMVAALEHLDVLNTFDVVYGSSAGASNAAYFLAQQANQGIRIYLDYLSGRQFIRASAILHGRPPVNLDYLYFEVMKRRITLDWQAVTASPIPLKVLASRVPEGVLDVLEAFESQDDLLRALHASSQMPLVAGAPFSYRGRFYWDAHLLDPKGIQTAIADGCTHILVLRSRPEGLRPRRLNPVEQLLIAPYIRKYSPSLADNFLSRFDQGTNNGAPGLSSQPFISELAPSLGSPDINRLEHRRDRLMAGAFSGMEAILDRFPSGPDLKGRVRQAFADVAEGSRSDLSACPVVR